MTGCSELYTYVNNKRLRRGHTTGTCAAAASKAAAEARLTQSPVTTVSIHTPKGITLELPPGARSGRTGATTSTPPTAPWCTPTSASRTPALT